MSIVGHDDQYCYRVIQEGLAADGNEWVNLQRDWGPGRGGAAGPHGERHERDLDAQPVPRLGPLHGAGLSAPP